MIDYVTLGLCMGVSTKLISQIAHNPSVTTDISLCQKKVAASVRLKAQGYFFELSSGF